jgi:hypothetical protein
MGVVVLIGVLLVLGGLPDPRFSRLGTIRTAPWCSHHSPAIGAGVPRRNRLARSAFSLLCGRAPRARV